MTTWLKWTVGVAVVAAAAFAGYRFGSSRTAATSAQAATTQPAGEETEPTVPVETIPVRRMRISEMITAYGTVLTQPGEVTVVSVPYESQVNHLLVTSGQQVQAGDPLLQVEPSAATRLQLVEAQNALTSATKDLEQTQQRYNEKLATNQDLLTAHNSLRSAKARLSSLESGGAAEPRLMKSPVAGVISKVDVQVGQIVTAGGALAEIAAQNHIEVMLAVEPEDIHYLHVDQPVRLFPVHLSASPVITGKIRLITQRVEPSTRLVNVLVTLPTGAPLVLQEYVRGELATRSKEALVVPRQAALPEQDQAVVYTVRDQHAVKHTVSLGLENLDEVEVIGGDLHAGDAAVVVGNYELSDGMQVEAVSAASSAPPSAAPTTSPALEPALAPALDASRQTAAASSTAPSTAPAPEGAP